MSTQISFACKKSTDWSKEVLLMTVMTATNAHNTFFEPLTAIVAHQVVVHKQKGLPPLTTDIAYIAFYYLLC